MIRSARVLSALIVGVAVSGAPDPVRAEAKELGWPDLHACVTEQAGLLLDAVAAIPAGADVPRDRLSGASHFAFDVCVAAEGRPDLRNCFEQPDPAACLNGIRFDLVAQLDTAQHVRALADPDPFKREGASQVTKRAVELYTDGDGADIRTECLAARPSGLGSAAADEICGIALQYARHAVWLGAVAVWEGIPAVPDRKVAPAITMADPGCLNRQEAIARQIYDREEPRPGRPDVPSIVAPFEAYSTGQHIVDACANDRAGHEACLAARDRQVRAESWVMTMAVSYAPWTEDVWKAIAVKIALDKRLVACIDRWRGLGIPDARAQVTCSIHLHSQETAALQGFERLYSR